MGNNQSAGIRYASPNEKRCIIRENLDHYRSLFVAGIYETSEAVDLTSKSTFLPGLRRAVQTHPALSVIVKDAHTERPFYVSCPITTLEAHVDILPSVETDGSTESEVTVIQRMAPTICDTLPAKDTPPWRIVVLPFNFIQKRRAFIAFTYSHTIGDGTTGLAFHKSFLVGLKDTTGLVADREVDGAMPEAFDTADRLPISWSFLLAPALGVYLPKFVASMFGFRAAASAITSSTWLGTPIFYEGEENFKTGVRIFVVGGSRLQKVLFACKKRDTKFTSVLSLVIARALSSAIPADSNVDNFVPSIAINMRPTVQVSNEQMGLYVSGYYDAHPRTEKEDNFWADASAMTSTLSAYATSLQDQAIGLLRFLPSVRSWTEGKIGTKRDASYEISNLLTFDPSTETGGDSGDVKWNIGNLFFCQPAYVAGAPLIFNVVSRKSGDLVCSVNWQIGSTGVGDAEAEQSFVDKVCKEVSRLLDDLA